MSNMNNQLLKLNLVSLFLTVELPASKQLSCRDSNTELISCIAISSIFIPFVVLRIIPSLSVTAGWVPSRVHHPDDIGTDQTWFGFAMQRYFPLSCLTNLALTILNELNDDHMWESRDNHVTGHVTGLRYRTKKDGLQLFTPNSELGTNLSYHMRDDWVT